jgi:hypothetical protein
MAASGEAQARKRVDGDRVGLDAVDVAEDRPARTCSLVRPEL